MKPPVHLPPLPADLKLRLVALRDRCWIASVWIGACVLAGTAGLLMLAQGWVDWWFGLPWLVRALLLFLDVALLVFLYQRYLHGSLRRRPTLSETAVLIERKWPHLQQGLVTAVELTEANSGATHGSLQVVTTILELARTRTLHLRFSDVLSLRRAILWGFFGVIISTATLTVFITAWPASFALLERMLLLHVPRPPKTVIVPISGDMIVATGSDVQLSVQAHRVVPAQGRVVITPADHAEPPYALDVVADKSGIFSITIANVQKKFGYHFQINDSQSSEHMVRPQPAPAIADLECVEAFPEYTNLPPAKLPLDGLSVLMGSHLRIHAHLTESVKTATMNLRGLGQTLSPMLGNNGTDLEVDIAIPVKGLTGFSIHLVDRDGVGSVNDTTYMIVPYPDRPPVFKWLEPIRKRETITLQAKPLLAFDATDDFALAKLTLNELITIPSTGVAATPPPTPQKASVPLTIQPAAKGIRYDYTLDAGQQTPAWMVGERVEYWIEAVDNNNVTGPGITDSAHKLFIIVTPEQKAAELRRRLALRSRDIFRLSEMQTDEAQDVTEMILHPSSVFIPPTPAPQPANK